LCSSIALYILTGAFTSPKVMLPDQIARGTSIGYPGGKQRQTSACAPLVVNPSTAADTLRRCR
jgi:hypothetical protein